MRQRSRYFLVVLMLMFAGNIFAQLNTGNNRYPYAKKFMISDNLLTSTFYKPKFKKIIPVSKSNSVYNPEHSCCGCLTEKTIRIINPLSPISKDFYTTQMGIVCKKEIQFEKKTSIPLRLRLGSLDYTNYLEQKPNALKPL